MIDLRMYQCPEFDTLDANNCRVHVEKMDDSNLRIFVEKEGKSVTINVYNGSAGLIVKVESK